MRGDAGQKRARPFSRFLGRSNSGFVRRGAGIASGLPLMIAAIRSLKSSTVSTGRCSLIAQLRALSNLILTTERAT